jgi:hypothetical protein
MVWRLTARFRYAGDHRNEEEKCVQEPESLSYDLATLQAGGLPGYEQFRTVVPARYDQVVRGVSFTPGTDEDGR